MTPWSSGCGGNDRGLAVPRHAVEQPLVPKVLSHRPRDPRRTAMGTRELRRVRFSRQAASAGRTRDTIDRQRNHDTKPQQHRGGRQPVRPRTRVRPSRCPAKDEGQEDDTHARGDPAPAAPVIVGMGSSFQHGLATERRRAAKRFTAQQKLVLGRAETSWGVGTASDHWPCRTASRRSWGRWANRMATGSDPARPRSRGGPKQL
jgi:hypothetical protein